MAHTLSLDLVANPPRVMDSVSALVGSSTTFSVAASTLASSFKGIARCRYTADMDDLKLYILAFEIANMLIID
jgi:hypothetical protein